MEHWTQNSVSRSSLKSNTMMVDLWYALPWKGVLKVTFHYILIL